MISILYQDSWLVVVRKPAGLHVHPTELSPRDEPTVLPQLRDQLGMAVHPVHRLDRATSGALVFALDRSTAQALGEDFREHRVEKTYWALVRGWYPPQLDIDWAVRDEKSGHPRPSRTLTLCLERYEIPLAYGAFPTNRTSLVEAKPLTGRRHQIRQHLSKVDHPILGDTSYGDSHQNRYFREHLDLPGLQLFSVRISFRHPATGQRLEVEAEPSGTERAFLDRLAPYRIPAEPVESPGQ